MVLSNWQERVNAAPAVRTVDLEHGDPLGALTRKRLMETHRYILQDSY